MPHKGVFSANCGPSPEVPAKELAFAKRENHTRGPRTSECNEEVWGGFVGWVCGVGHPGSPRSCSILLRQDGTHYRSERTTPGAPAHSRELLDQSVEVRPYGIEVRRECVGWVILLRQDGTCHGSERTSPGVPGLSSAARKSGVGLAGGGQGGSQATPFAAQRLQIREARKNFLCKAQKPCRLRGFAAARVLPGV